MLSLNGKNITPKKKTGIGLSKIAMIMLNINNLLNRFESVE